MKYREFYSDILLESDEDYSAALDFVERRDRELDGLATELKNSEGKGRIKWKTVPASLLKRVWFIFGKYNRINENDMDKISDQILTNIARLKASNEMMGRENYDVRDELEDNGFVFTDTEWDVWMERFFQDNEGQYIVSDYGMRPLEHAYVEIFKAKTPEEQLYAVDKALNIIHQRSDLSALFVEGGKKTLSDIARRGGYSGD
jgi:hypothetical protein